MKFFKTMKYSSKKIIAAFTFAVSFTVCQEAVAQEMLRAKEVIATEPVKPRAIQYIANHYTKGEVSFQEIDEDPDYKKNVVFDVIEQMPSFPGGTSALMQYLGSHIKYPVIAEENGIQGRVICTFIVETDGSITDVRVVKPVDPSLDKEALRVIKSMPRWIPGKHKGSLVRVKYTLPVTFRLQ